MNQGRVAFAIFAGALALAFVVWERPDVRIAAARPAAPPPPPVVAVQDAAPVVPPPRSAEVLPDSLLTGRIQSAILSDPGMAGADVSVTSIHGVVSLTGSVQSQEQLALASALAQREDGVMRVDPDLELNPQ